MAGGGINLWDEPMNEALFGAGLDAQFMSTQTIGSDRLVFHVNVVKRRVLKFINRKCQGPILYDPFLGGLNYLEQMPTSFLHIYP